MPQGVNDSDILMERLHYPVAIGDGEQQQMQASELSTEA